MVALLRMLGTTEEQNNANDNLLVVLFTYFVVSWNQMYSTKLSFPSTVMGEIIINSSLYPFLFFVYSTF